jgi:hypothetical protein
VDPEALGIPDYPSVVRNPMDLGTVRSRLVTGQYGTAQEVAADVALVWANCRRYNAAGSAIW